METKTQRNHHQHHPLAGSDLLSLHHLRESETLISLIEKGDIITWLWEGIKYAGKVTGKITSTIICAVTPDRKEWTVFMNEIVELKQH